jgi:hypothetical protein
LLVRLHLTKNLLVYNKMGLFSFVETFFFVSLGITFILILLLVYHFRQRFISLEQKCDTMFELINNIVTELNNERRSTHGFGVTSPPVLFYPEPDGRPTVGGQAEKPEPFTDMDDSDDDIDDDDEDSDDADSDDEDSDDEYSNSDEDCDSEDDSESALIHVAPIEETDNNSVKVILLDQVEQLTELPVDAMDDTDSDDNDKPIDLVASDPIVVEKLDVQHLEQVPAEPHAEKVANEVYNKMSIQALKTLVITKGLSSDPSKMKKAELIKLLETGSQ